MEWIIITAVFIFSILWVGLPFIKGLSGSYVTMSADLPRHNLELRKEELLTSLADLSMDVKTGKMAQDDFNEVYGETMAEAARVYGALEKKDV
ncbi:hypothetical protein K1X76_11085 [bacterium]|nr:hypothetical protein [bacterium]